MARGRLISKSLSTSERWSHLHKANRRLAEFAQSMYPLMVAHSDDFGRLPGDVFTVRHAINPTSPRKDMDFDEALVAMVDVGLIERYQVAGKIYIQIVDFEPHQPGLHKRTKSKFPEPPGNSGNFREFPSELKRTEPKRREEKKPLQTQENQRASAPRSPAQLRMELRSMANTQRHLKRACDLEIKATPGISDEDLVERLKVIAARKLRIVDYDCGSIRDIVRTIRAVHARQAGRPVPRVRQVAVPRSMDSPPEPPWNHALGELLLRASISAHYRFVWFRGADLDGDVLTVADDDKREWIDKHYRAELERAHGGALTIRRAS